MSILIQNAGMIPNRVPDSTKINATLKFEGQSFSGSKQVVVTFTIHPYPEVAFFINDQRTQNASAIFNFSGTKESYQRRVEIINGLPKHDSFQSGLIEVFAKAADGTGASSDNIAFLFD